MQYLNNKQVEFIYLDILRKGITSPALQDDLVDHICFLVEEELAHTPDFNIAYKKTISNFGSLRTLQVVTDEEIRTAAWYTTIFKILNYMATLGILLLSIALLILPFIIGMNSTDVLFPYLFFPTIITGIVICCTRINYREFKLVAF